VGHSNGELIQILKKSLTLVLVWNPKKSSHKMRSTINEWWQCNFLEFIQCKGMS
jgi:hypothetical protein